MKCALNCVHGCLGKCSHVYSQDGIGPSRTCYMDCTRKCLPTCVSNAKDGDDFDLASLGGQLANQMGKCDPGDKSAKCNLMSYLAQSATPTDSHELKSTKLPREPFRGA